MSTEFRKVAFHTLGCKLNFAELSMLKKNHSYITRTDMPVWEYPNGQQLTLSVFRIKGNKKARSVYIQANIHGSEIQGNGVIYHLLQY